MSRYLAKLINLIVDDPMTGTVASKALQVEQSRTIGIHIVFTGTPTGTFTVEASNDEVDWVNLPFTEGAILAAGSGDSHALTLKEYPYEFVRVVYTFTSGSGVLNVKLKTKG